MIWWVRARRADLLLLGVAGFALLALLLQDTAAVLPSITLSGGTRTQIMLFAPVPLVAVVALCLDSRLEGPETSGVRPVRMMDVALVASAMLAAFAVSAAVAVLGDSSAAWTAGRNTVFLTGLMLCARPLIGQPAAMVPVGWIMAVILVGFRTFKDPYPWAIVPEPLASPRAAIATALVFAAGVVAHLRTTRSAP